MNISLVYSECPAPDRLYPCTCYKSIASNRFTFNILCEGRDVKSVNLGNLGSTHFTSRSVSQTSVTTIDDNALGDTKFALIYVQNNTMLETITDKVFANQEMDLLMIRYNENNRLRHN